MPLLNTIKAASFAKPAVLIMLGKVGDYEFVSRVGRGAFGVVFKGKKDGKIFAVKMLDEGKAPDIEVSVGKNISVVSPFLVKYHRTFRDSKFPGEIFIVMDWCSGGDIRKLLNSLDKKKGIVLTPQRVMKILIQLLLGLYELHRNNIIHRDLKPDNVFVDDSYNVKIGDFGCEKNTFLEFPTYSSPELIQGKRCDYKMDVWALGVMMFELCCLEPPFCGDNPVTLYVDIVNKDFTKIPKGLFSDDLREAIHSMLQKNQHARPSIRDLLGLGFVQSHARELSLFKYFPGEVVSSSPFTSLYSSLNASGHFISVKHPAKPAPIIRLSCISRASSAPKQSGRLHNMEFVLKTAPHLVQAIDHVFPPANEPVGIDVNETQHVYLFNPKGALFRVCPEFIIVKQIAENKVYLVLDKKKKENYVVKIIRGKEEGLEVNQELLQCVAACEFIVHYQKTLKLDTEHCCLVMEYCAGGDLAQAIAERKESGGFFSDEEICTVVIQIGRGLNFLHTRDKGIVHRDVKTKNIFISEKGTYKLGDFGSATRMKTTNSHRKTVVGTDGYMAPEVLKQEGYTASADVFSFGIVLYEMIALRNPYYILGSDGEVGYSVSNALNADIPPLHSTHNSSALIALVMRFLAKEPHDRITIAQSLESEIIADFVATKK